MTDRVDVLDARHFAQQSLHRKADTLRHLFRRGPRHLNKNVEHGHHDLRLFLSRSFENTESAEKQRSDDHQRCQFRINETVGNTTSQAQTP